MTEPPTMVYHYGKTTVTVGDGWVKTTLADGTTIHAIPGTEAEDRARAASLGYGEGDGALWAMTRDHDRFHAWLAYGLGLKESPALRQTAQGQQSELAGAEEEVILALQRFINLCRAARLMA